MENLQPNLTPVLRAVLAKDFIKKVFILVEYIGLKLDFQKEAWAEYKETTLNPILEILTQKLNDEVFFVGHRLTWADIAVAEVLSRFTGCFDGNFIHNHPILKNHMMTIEREPSLARYIADRPSANF